MKVWDWIKRSWKVVLAVLGAVLAVAVGAGWLWSRSQGRLGAVQDEETVRRARERIAELSGMREELARRVGEEDVAVAAVDRQLLENKRSIVEAHVGGAGLTDDHVLEEFRRLGY